MPNTPSLPLRCQNSESAIKMPNIPSLPSRCQTFRVCHLDDILSLLFRCQHYESCIQMPIFRVCHLDAPCTPSLWLFFDHKLYLIFFALDSHFSRLFLAPYFCYNVKLSSCFISMWFNASFFHVYVKTHLEQSSQQCLFQCAYSYKPDGPLDWDKSFHNNSI